MKTTIRANGDVETTMKLRSGLQVDLVSDEDGEDVVASIGGEKVGSMSFRIVELGQMLKEDYLKLRLMDVDELYRRQGIGEAMLKLAKEVSGLEIVAACPADLASHEDGSNLIGDGPSFVAKMRSKGLVHPGCLEPCYCENGYEPDDD